MSRNFGVLLLFCYSVATSGYSQREPFSALFASFSLFCPTISAQNTQTGRLQQRRLIPMKEILCIRYSSSYGRCGADSVRYQSLDLPRLAVAIVPRTHQEGIARRFSGRLGACLSVSRRSQTVSLIGELQSFLAADPAPKREKGRGG